MGAVISAGTKFKVDSLPEMNDGKPFDFSLWTGYLPVEGTTKHLHYMFVESFNNSAENPLILWFNGGPGCSSMLGFS